MKSLSSKNNTKLMDRVICKVDYGQFEVNKIYNYSTKIKSYIVQGQYGETNFNRNQFNTIFSQLNNTNIKPNGR